jgi:hypothetical protein
LVDNLAVRGSSMGFSIRSSLQFRTLRTGGGSPLNVERWSGPAPQGEELIAWRARPGNPFHGRLLRNGARYAFWASDAGWYIVDPEVPSIAVEESGSSLLAELRLLGVPSSLCAVEAGDITLHASGVVIDGEAVLFAAPSMYGKTTIAAAFAANGHRLLGEDTIRCGSSPPPVAYPGPAVVRLRSDVASHIRLPHAVPHTLPNGRVCMILNADRRGDGSPLPLRAIFVLRADERVSIGRISPALAARDLFALSFLLPTVEHRAANFARIVDLVSRVQVLDLFRPLSLASNGEVIQAVENYIRH